MALLQLVAASLAGVDALALHTGPAEGSRPLAEAVALATSLTGPSPIPAPELLDRIESERFRWGVSNGT